MTVDEKYMQKCVELARKSGKTQDFPFGALITLDGLIISESGNESLTKNQVYRHAEIIALTQAQEKIGVEAISKCTIYTTIEPCPMCSFTIRELRVGRVVFGLTSPIMGGYSKWSILQDQGLGITFPKTFATIPSITSGVLSAEVIACWREWNPEKWNIFVEKGVFMV